MTQPLDRTRPTAPVDQLQEAINLARAGRKVEARDALRQVVALQPLNQAAWLWLSAVTPEPDEAKAALAQARRINPLQASLPQAEQWLAKRFATQPSSRTLAQNPGQSGSLSQAAQKPERETRSVEVDPAPKAGVQSAPSLAGPELTVPLPLLSRPTQPNQMIIPPAGLRPQGEAWYFPIFGQYWPKNLARIFHLIALAVVAAAVMLGLIVLFLGLTRPVGAITPAQWSATGSIADNSLNDRPAALDEAWAKRDWTQALSLLEGLRQAQPNSQSIGDQLTHAYLQKGIALRHKGFIEAAQPYFEQALLLTPTQLRAQQEQRLASDYLTAVQHYQAGEWADVIAGLEAVRAEDHHYIHVKDLLFSAYYNQGLALQAAGKMRQARQALEAAIALRPDLPEPRREIADIEFALAPQTMPKPSIPSASTKDKLIVVGVAEQRMWVFEKGIKVFDFIVSTGEPGSDTAIGEFEILDKIDVAYASLWNLDMPYWMGIYWADSTMENGIHSLPIVRRTGYKLWDGYLGQRVSYGCVILGDEDAATLYKWADVGTKVRIVSSLESWAAAKEKF